MALNTRSAHSSLHNLHRDLSAVVNKNPAAAVEAPALEAIEALVKATDELEPGHPVVAALVARIPFSGLKAKEALVVVGQLQAAIPVPGPSIA